MILGGSLLLAACGSSDSGSSSNGTTSISGSAATGAAMTSGTVELSCKNGLKKSGIAISASGVWSTTIPTANLPCAVKASDGTNTYYSFTVGNGSSIVSNVTPLTTLALAQILGATPASLFATLSATDLAKLNDSAINTAISALNTALADYALPAGFNPVTSPLTAATTTQGGNAYDGLLDQFNAALGATTLDSLITDAATGAMPALPTPDYTEAADSFSDFFTTFAGDYSLKVHSSGAEGSNNAAAIALFPQDRAITVHLKANGDVSIDAVGRTLSYNAATYSAVGDRFDATATTNTVRYRAGGTTAGNCCDLYITYSADNGKLQVDAQGFVNTEGYASLRGSIVAPPTALPVPPVVTCSAGDDKLVFSNAPSDFCGFSRSTSAMTMAHYFMFSSAAGAHGTTLVKFSMNSDDSAVEGLMIEDNNYAFACGGAHPACSGITVTSGSSYKQFVLSNTALAVIYGADNGITVNGLLIHPVTSAPSSSQPISLTSIGYNKSSADIAPLVGQYTGTQGVAVDGGVSTNVSTCTIGVNAGGVLKVNANGKSISATFDGETGDFILNPTGSFFNALASDVSLNNYARVSVQRGYVTQAIASHGAGGLNEAATDRVDCFVVNPNPTTLGTVLGSGDLNGGATASDLPAAYAGTYSNGTCSLTISNDGTFTASLGSDTFTAKLGGDQDDRVVNNSGAGTDPVSLTITDRKADGQILKLMSVNHYPDGHFQLGNVKLGNSILTAFNYPACTNLVKP